MEANQEYFVFISYSSLDNEWAIWLRDELEHYHLPTSFNGRTDVRDNLRKVFRDRDELSAGPEWDEQVNKALANTNNLIVICSPNAAKSDAVNKEVKTFIALGKEDHIFPFIVEGEPKDCFPPALKHSKLGGDIKKDGGSNAAFIKVVSGMLKVGFPSLWERYEREKAEEERKTREQRDNLLRIQSRFLAEKTNTLVEEGDSYTARLLALEALPKDLDNPDRPYTSEAEKALRNAYDNESAILKGHTDIIHTLSFSPDGEFLVSTSRDTTLRIWKTSTGECIRTINHSNIVLFAIFCPNRRTIISASAENNYIHFWDVATGKHQRVLKGHTGGILSAAFSPKGDLLASTSKDGSIRIWDVSTWNSITIIKMEHEHPACSILFSSDGKRIYSRSSDDIRVWDTSSGKCLTTIEGHTDLIQSVAFSPDGSRFVTAAYDTIRIWDTSSGKCFNTIKEHSDLIQSVAFSPDGSRLATASNDTIRVWDTFSGKHLTIFDKNVRNVRLLLFSPDGKRIVSASWNNNIYFSDIPSKFRPIIISESTNKIKAATFSPDGKFIFSASSDCIIRIWETISGRCVRILSIDEKSAISKIECDSNCTANLFEEQFTPYFAFYPDGKRIISIISSHEICTWDFTTGQLLMIMKGNWYTTTLSPDGSRLVTASNDTIRIWDTFSGKCLNTIKEHSDWSQSATFSPDGTYFVTISNDTIRIWDSFSGKCLNTIKEHSDWSQPASFSPDGNYFATVSINTIRIWNTSTGECFRTINHLCIYIKFNPDGNSIASLERNSIYIWDIKTGQLRGTFEGHEDEIRSFIFSPKGNLLASISRDESIRIWNIETYQLIKVMKGSGNYLKFSPDGKHLLFKSDSGSIYMWDIPPFQELIDETRKRFKNRQLTPEERKKYYLD